MRGGVDLVLLGDQPYLISNDAEGSINTVSVYLVDLESTDLIRIFAGGTRSSGLHTSTTYPVEDGILLIDIGGGSITALDVTAAAEAIQVSLQDPQ